MTNVGHNTPAEVVSHYRLLRKLGAGGMGEVYLAEDTDLGRPVAIKFLTDYAGDPDACKRLLREARAAAALDHPNICTVHEVSAHSTPPFIVMQYVEGETLAARLRRGPLPADEVIRLGMEMADALSAAHREGIVHRDVKPQNIILTPGGHAKLLDFGIAKHRSPDASLGSEATQTITHAGIVGTPAYMAPEQIQCGAIDGRTDLFALGAVLHEAFTGSAPFSGHSQLDVFAAILHVEPPQPSRVVPALTEGHDQLCARLLKKNPDDRFQSAAEVITALRELGGETVRGRTARIAERPFSRAKLAGAVTVLLAAGFATFWLLRERPLSIQPSPQAAPWFERGVSALQEGAYLQASRALTRAVQLDPEYPLGWTRLAEAQLELDEEDHAHESVLRAARLVDDRSRLPVDERLAFEATMGMVQRDYGQAQRSYIALLGRQPTSAPVRLDLGRAYEAGEASDKAIEQYLAASRLDPDNPAAFLRLGILHGRQDRVDDAMKAFAQAETLYEASGRFEGVAAVSLQRGIVLSRLGDRSKEAHESLERARNIAENVRSPHLTASALFRLSSLMGTQGMYREAEQYARTALDVGRDLDSLTAFGLVDLGNVFVYSEQYDRAAQYFEQALRLAQASNARRAEARARLAIGSLQMSQGQVEEATANATAALDYYQQAGFRGLRVFALTLIAQGQSRTGDFEGAQKNYESLLHLAEERNVPRQVAEQHNQLAVLLLARERYEKALDHCDRALTLFRAMDSPYDRAHALLLRGEILGRLGRFTEAERELASLFAGRKPAAKATPELHRLWLLRKSMLSFLRGQLPAARDFAVEGLESSEAGGARDIDIEFHLVLALGLIQADRAEAGLTRLETAREMAKGMSDRVLSSRLELARATALLALRRPGEARSVATSLAERCDKEGRFECAWLSYSVASRAAVLVGEPDDARAWRERADRAQLALDATLTPAARLTMRQRKDLPQVSQ